MPRIIADLQGFEQYAWVATAYMVASTAIVPIVGEALRPVWAAPVPDRRGGVVPGRIGALRRERGHGPVDPVPRSARPRRGRDDGDVLHRCRRSLPAGEARPHPRVVRQRLGAGVGHRPARRRPAHRPLLVALGVLRKRPARVSGPGRARVLVPEDRAGGAAPSDRLSRRSDAALLGGAAADGALVGRRTVRLDVHTSCGIADRDDWWVGGVCLRRAPCPGADPAAGPARESNDCRGSDDERADWAPACSRSSCLRRSGCRA